MKSTVVDESLSYYKTNVLFQRILQDFMLHLILIILNAMFAVHITSPNKCNDAIDDTVDIM